MRVGVEEGGTVDWRKFVPFLLVTIVVLAYGNSFTGAFVFDDGHVIVHNDKLRSDGSLLDTISLPRRWLVDMSFALNYRASGRTLLPTDFRVVNIGLHILSGLMLYAMIWQTLAGPALRARYGKYARAIATACSAIWLVHPLQTESVTYICQRYESMMGFFYLLTMYLFIRATRAEGMVRRRWYVLSVLACLLGSGTKEVIVTLPLAVLLYDVIFVSRSIGRALKTRYPYYLGLCLCWLMLFVVQAGIQKGPGVATYVTGQDGSVVASSVSSSVANGNAPSSWNYLLSQAEVIPYYLRLAVFPHPLCLDYDWREVHSLREVLPGFAGLCMVVVLTLYLLTRRSAWSFPLAWFFLALAPSSSIVPLSDRAAEHRIYLALAPAVITVVVAGFHLAVVLSHRLLRLKVMIKITVSALVALVVIALGSMTHLRNDDYRSQEAIWRDVVSKRPANPRGHHNLGISIASAGNYAEAIPHLRRAVKLLPSFFSANNDLGLCLIERGEMEEGLLYCRRALELARNRGMAADAHLRIGYGLYLQGSTNEAIAHYEDVTSILRNVPHRRESVQANYRLAQIFDEAGATNRAMDYYREALKGNPEHVPSHNNLGAMLLTVGYTTEGMWHLREANRINPNYAQARHNLSAAMLRISQRKK